jgi:hypothetical protein
VCGDGSDRTHNTQTPSWGLHVHFGCDVVCSSSGRRLAAPCVHICTHAWTTCDMWRMTCDMWRMTCDMWRVTCLLHAVPHALYACKWCTSQQQNEQPTPVLARVTEHSCQQPARVIWRSLRLRGPPLLLAAPWRV